MQLTPTRSNSLRRVAGELRCRVSEPLFRDDRDSSPARLAASSARDDTEGCCRSSEIRSRRTPRRRRAVSLGRAAWRGRRRRRRRSNRARPRRNGCTCEPAGTGVAGRPPANAVSATRRARLDEPPTRSPNASRASARPSAAGSRNCADNTDGAISPQRPSARQLARPPPGDSRTATGRRRRPPRSPSRLAPTASALNATPKSRGSDKRANAGMLIQIAERVERRHRVAGSRRRFGHRPRRNAGDEHAADRRATLGTVDAESVRADRGRDEHQVVEHRAGARRMPIVATRAPLLCRRPARSRRAPRPGHPASRSRAKPRRRWIGQLRRRPSRDGA